MTVIFNLTPHPIHIVDENNNIIKTFESNGIVRLKASTVDAGYSVEGCKITKTVFGEVVGLPDEHISYCADSCRGDYDDGGFACVHYTEGKPCGFGHNMPSSYYIVSQLVKSALSERKDLLVPAEVVRDTNGNIVGCKSLGI